LPNPIAESLRSFLGVANYYKCHIDHFSEVCVPLTDLLKKGQPTKFVFNERQRDAFNLIKERLMSTTKLNTPDPNKPFVLHCDASEYAIGACLSQINDRDKNVQLLSCQKS